MNSPKVSIIMPSLNVAPYIRECIESAVNQTLQDIEIICVDAGSTDGTLEILQEYAEKDSRIQIIHSDKKSYGYQVNLGFDAAIGKYFAILETDDIVDKNMYFDLSRIADFYNVDIIKADFCRFVEKNGEIIEQAQKIAHNGMYNKPISVKYNLKNIIQNASLYTWAGLYRRDFLIENGIRHNETPGASYQDNGFWFLTMSSADTVYFYDKIFYKLRRDNPNSSFFNKGKVYCICDEYEFVLAHLNGQKERYAPVMPYFWAARLGAYIFNYNRIAPEFREEFLNHFRDIIGKAEPYIDSTLFSADSWNFICKVRDNSKITDEDETRPLRNYEDASLLTRCLWYIKDFGIVCTIKRALHFLFGKFFHKKQNAVVMDLNRQILAELNKLDRRNEDRTNRIITEIRIAGLEKSLDKEKRHEYT